MLKNAKAYKSQVNVDVKKYLGIVKFIVFMVIIASALTLLYYLFSRTVAFSQIINFFKGIY